MKKILSVFLCLLLLAALATPVLAAQSAKMTVTASETKLKPGDKVTFTVSVTKVEKVKTGGFQFSFDKSVFSYESGKSLPALEGYMAGVSTAADKVAGFFMNGKGALEGELFRITLKVRDDAAPGTYTVAGKPSLTADGAVDCTVAEARVTVSAAASKPDKTDPTVPSVSVPVTLPIPEKPIDSVLPDDAQTPVSGEPVTGQVQQQTLPQLQTQEEGAPQKPAFPWWIVAVIAVVAVGGAVFLILEIKKSKNTP